MRYTVPPGVSTRVVTIRFYGSVQTSDSSMSWNEHGCFDRINDGSFFLSFFKSSREIIKIKITVFLRDKSITFFRISNESSDLIQLSRLSPI